MKKYKQYLESDEWEFVPYSKMNNGGVNSYKTDELSGNVEVESGEVILTPEGLSDTVMGKKHSEGGEVMNLPPDSRVFSDKLKVETPKGKKSYSDLAKPFETKKNFDMLNSKKGDDIQKVTADMMIKFKNQKLDELFQVQENNKLNGLHSKAIQNSTIEEYKMKYGGLTKAQNGNEVWNPQTFKTPEGINTPTNISLNKNPLTNWEQYRDQWEKIAQESGQLKKGERFKATKDMQEFMYDWALDNNPSLLQDMWKTYGVTNKDEKKYQNKDFSNIQDLKDLRGNFIDNFRGKRVFSPELGKKVEVVAPKGVAEKELQNIVPPEIQFKNNTQYLKPDFSPNINLGIPMPDMLQKGNLNYYKTDPNYINSRYLDIQPQLNSVLRGQKAFQNNLGSRGTADISNLLQSQINAYDQNQQIYGQKYNYDRNQDATSQQFNAQAKTQNDQYNQNSWYNQLETGIRGRDAAIGDQELTNQYRGEDRINQGIQFANTKNFIDKTYPYYSKMNLEQGLAAAQLDHPEWFNPYNIPDKTATKKKLGGKVQLKPKLKTKKYKY